MTVASTCRQFFPGVPSPCPSCPSFVERHPHSIHPLSHTIPFVGMVFCRFITAGVISRRVTRRAGLRIGRGFGGSSVPSSVSVLDLRDRWDSTMLIWSSEDSPLMIVFVFFQDFLHAFRTPPLSLAFVGSGVNDSVVPHMVDAMNCASPFGKAC